jgi:hypothetical protein
VGFTSGLAGGWNSKMTLSGNSDESKLWAGALSTWMMCNCSGYCIEKSCKYAPKQTLSKWENSQKKLFPVALDTAPYSQKHSYFHWCFPTGFTPESVSLRRRIVYSPSRVSSLHQNMTFLYLFTWGKALSKLLRS